MISKEKIAVTIETLKALTTEAIKAEEFEAALRYDNARIEIERRDK